MKKLNQIFLPVDVVDCPLFPRLAQKAGTTTAAAFYVWCAHLLPDARKLQQEDSDVR